MPAPPPRPPELNSARRCLCGRRRRIARQRRAGAERLEHELPGPRLNSTPTSSGRANCPVSNGRPRLWADFFGRRQGRPPGFRSSSAWCSTQRHCSSRARYPAGGRAGRGTPGARTGADRRARGRACDPALPPPSTSHADTFDPPWCAARRSVTRRSRTRPWIVAASDQPGAAHVRQPRIRLGSAWCVVPGAARAARPRALTGRRQGAPSASRGDQRGARRRRVRRIACPSRDEPQARTLTAGTFPAMAEDQVADFEVEAIVGEGTWPPLLPGGRQRLCLALAHVRL